MMRAAKPSTPLGPGGVNDRGVGQSENASAAAVALGTNPSAIKMFKASRTETSQRRILEPNAFL